MITQKSQYKYVDFTYYPEALINGGIYPLRSNKDELRSEDFAFALECSGTMLDCIKANSTRDFYNQWYRLSKTRCHEGSKYALKEITASGISNVANVIRRSDSYSSTNPDCVIPRVTGAYTIFGGHASVAREPTEWFGEGSSYDSFEARIEALSPINTSNIGQNPVASDDDLQTDILQKIYADISATNKIRFVDLTAPAETHAKISNGQIKFTDASADGTELPTDTSGLGFNYLGATPQRTDGSNSYYRRYWTECGTGSGGNCLMLETNGRATTDVWVLLSVHHEFSDVVRRGDSEVISEDKGAFVKLPYAEAEGNNLYFKHLSKTDMLRIASSCGITLRTTSAGKPEHSDIGDHSVSEKLMISYSYACAICKFNESIKW